MDEELEYEKEHDNEETEKEEDHEESEDSSDDSDTSSSSNSDDDDFDPDVAYYQKKLKEVDKLRRATFAQAKKIEELEAERNNLRGVASQSFNFNVAAEKERLEREISRAKGMLAISIQENDAFKIADANAELAKSSAKLAQFETWESTRQPESEQQYDYQEQQPQIHPHQLESIQQWLSVNDDVDNRSANFNPELAQRVNSIGENINARLIQEGNSHLIGTPDYIELIDRITAEQRREVYTGRSSNPNVEGRGYSHPVRRSGTTSGNSRTVTLSKEEREFAQNMNIDPKAFLQAKLARINRRED